MTRSFHRRPLVMLGCVAITAVLSAPAAMAHQGHGSCAQGAQTFTKPTAQARQLDEAARAAAQSGEPGAGDESATLHETGSQPRP